MRQPSASPECRQLPHHKKRTPSHGWRAEIHLASAEFRRVTRARTHNSLNSRGLSGTHKRLSTAANSSAVEPVIPQIDEPAGLWVQFPLAGIWRKKKRRRRLKAYLSCPWHSCSDETRRGVCCGVGMRGVTPPLWFTLSVVTAQLSSQASEMVSTDQKFV